MSTARSSQPKRSPQLLDTQLLLWLAISPDLILATVRAELSDRRLPLLYSLVSLWEVAIKPSLGEPGFLVAEAIHAKLTLLTADRTLSRYGPQVVWVGTAGTGG